MGEMTPYSIDELASQADSRGVTLAEVLASELSATETERLQAELQQRMAENSRRIEDFMADVEVPSLADLCNLSSHDLDEIQHDIESALSDDALIAVH